MDDLFGTSNATAAATSDPTEDFLRREQEALGADATSFGNTLTTSAGITNGGSADDKDFETRASAFPDLESGESPVIKATESLTAAPDATEDNEISAFESQFPAVEVPVTTGPIVPVVTGVQSSLPQAEPVPHELPAESSLPSATTPAVATPKAVEEESEFIKEAAAKREEEIEKREVEYTKIEEDTIVKARNEIDNFYKEYNAKKEKAISANKENEEKFLQEQEDALAEGTTWERICKLVELNDSRSKTTTQSKQDLSRFKEILLSLKREGDTAPGAAGY